MTVGLESPEAIGGRTLLRLINMIIHPNSLSTPEMQNEAENAIARSISLVQRYGGKSVEDLLAATLSRVIVKEKITEIPPKTVFIEKVKTEFVRFPMHQKEVDELKARVSKANKQIRNLEKQLRRGKSQEQNEAGSQPEDMDKSEQNRQGDGRTNPGPKWTQDDVESLLQTIRKNPASTNQQLADICSQQFGRSVNPNTVKDQITRLRQNRRIPFGNRKLWMNPETWDGLF